MIWARVPSPIGDLGVAVSDAGLAAIHFTGPAGPTGPDEPLLDAVRQQLDEYFAGARTGFTLPLAPPSGTAFERAVWQRIAAIPYGETATYGQIAAEVGAPDDRRLGAAAPGFAADDRWLGVAPPGFAARAVGAACHRNPVPLVVPCHRVVGAGGKLVGFGGGLHRKRYLLELEARVWIEAQFTGGSPT